MNGALCTVHLVTVSVLVLSVPSSPDAPDFRNVTSASVTLVWDEPAEPNGVLLYYVIYQNGTEIKRVTGNVTKYVAVGLQPFTVYVFKLSVCTAVGCSNSSDSVPMRTLESGECVAKSSMYHLFYFFFSQEYVFHSTSCVDEAALLEIASRLRLLNSFPTMLEMYVPTGI